PRGTARRRVPPLGAGVDLCRDAGTGARRPDRTPPGSSVRSDLPAQRCIRPGRRGVRVNASADERTRQRRLLEAVLFAAAEPLTEEELTERLSEGVELGLLLVELAEIYSERGVNLVRLAGGWAFRTAPDLAPLLVSERPVTRKLSRAAVETLAIV